MRRATARAGWVLIGGLGGGCAEPEPVDEPVEPARIVVEPAPGARLCAGTEAWLSGELARAQAETGLEPRFDLPVILGETAVAERCTDTDDPETVIGCTVGDGALTTVITGPAALAHELVHGLRRHYDLRTRAMFEEGFAEVVGGSDAYPRFVQLEPDALASSRQPETMVQLGPADFREAERYAASTHFLDAVAAEHGLDALAAFMRGGIDDTAEAATHRFEAHFGRSLADHAQAWRDAGVVGLGRGDLCPAGAESVTADEFALQATVRCDGTETMGLSGAGEVAWVRRCVELPAGRYEVELSAQTGSVRWDPVPGSCPETADGFDVTPKQIDATSSGSLPFAACRWAVTFRSTAEEPEDLELRMRRE